MDTLTQIGVGGILAVLLLREVFAFLKTRNGRSDHAQTAEYHRVLTEVFQQTIVPILGTQTQILVELRVLNAEMMRSLAVMLDRMSPRG